MVGIQKARHFGRRFVRIMRTQPGRLPGHILRTVGYRTLYRVFCMLPLKENKVFFASDRNADMTGNFQCVYEEMKSRDRNFRYRFMLNNRQEKSLWQLARLAYEMATSKCIFLDDFFYKVYGLKIREGAELIQLWHAVGAFKRFGFSRVGRIGAASIRSQNHRNYTKAIVSSKNIAKHYAEAFGINAGKVVATGIPRTDMLFDEIHKNKVRADIYATFPQLHGKKVITYAPTFRGSGQHDAKFDMAALNMRQLYEALHADYVFLWRMHPFIRQPVDIPEQYQSFFIDITSSREMNDWLFVTDVLITDYSSVCFEAALLNIPMLFFAFDLATYTKQRDFYYDYESFVPGPIVSTTTELVTCVKEQSFALERLKSFVDYFFDHVDGRSSARVVDWLLLGQHADEVQPFAAIVPPPIATALASETTVSASELV